MFLFCICIKLKEELERSHTTHFLVTQFLCLHSRCNKISALLFHAYPACEKCEKRFVFNSVSLDVSLHIMHTGEKTLTLTISN